MSALEILLIRAALHGEEIAYGMTQVTGDTGSPPGATTGRRRTPRHVEIAGFLAWLMASAIGLPMIGIILSSEPDIATIIFGGILLGTTGTLLVAGHWLHRNERRGAATFAAFLVLSCLPLAWAWRDDLVLVGIAGLGIALAILMIVHCLHGRPAPRTHVRAPSASADEGGLD